MIRNYILSIFVFLIATLATIALADSLETAVVPQRSCTYPRFQRCDFFIQGITYLPTEFLRTVPNDKLKHFQSNRLRPPFPEMLGETPKETFLNEIKGRIQNLEKDNLLEKNQLFVNAFLRPQSLFGHIFPDEHKQVFFFPFCCDLKNETEASVRKSIEDLVQDGYFAGWWQDATVDLLEKLFYEYNVFGSCSEFNGVKEYFSTVKRFFSQLEFQSILFDKAEVKSGINNKHQTSTIRNTLREILDVQVVFQCLHDPVDKKPLLHQVWLCYDKDQKIIDCPLQLQSEESCIRKEKALSGGSVEFEEFYIPTWEDALNVKALKEDL